MSSSLRFLAAALPAVAVALDPSNGAPFDFGDPRVVQEPGLIRFPVTAIESGSVIGAHAKRQIEVGSLAALSGTMYTVDIGLGTPGQTVPVIFDTGSSELWVNPDCSKSTDPNYCNEQPRFTSSSTLVVYGVQGSVTYGTGYADFNYVSDYVRLGSASVAQQIFGVAHDSAHATVGIMGAGPALGGWASPYPFVIDSLAQQGVINSRAFSMDLRGFDSAAGAVIFGGIDTKKYQGSLFKAPVVPAAQSPDGWTRWWMRLSGIKVNQPNGNVVDVYTKSTGQPGQTFLVDSGYTLTALPTSIFNQLLAAFPSAVYVPSADLYLVDCMDPGEGGTIDFIFGDENDSKTIKVRYYDFVWHAPGTNLCVLGAFEDDFPVLGDTFLRSAYVVYDWDNREIHLAQSENCGTNLVAIGKGANAVPNIVGECSPSVALSSESSSAVPSSSVSASAAPSSSASASSSAAPISSSVPGSSSAPSSSIPSSAVPISSSIPSSASSAYPSITPSSSIPVDTITYTLTDIYTITSCPPHVTNCHAGHVTTAIIPVTTTVCPQTTATYAIPQTYVCPGVAHGCKPGETLTTMVPITLKPQVPGGKPTAVPQGPNGGSGGAPVHVPQPTGGPGGIVRPGHGVPGRPVPAAPGGEHGGNGGGYIPHPTGGVPVVPPSPTGAKPVGGGAPTTFATQAPATYGEAKPTGGVYTAGAAQVVAPWLAGLAVWGVML
ncbi:peptidase A1 [Podospora aff. communis PSN243]|uniref:Peptidase A1 n=1 Tax=Podospora aff. communis PSN243 TaxID=3040156 RepID=A0AAV9GSA6_9PEZI|nr:peptidase A1 [Podospora aff. communis PSN243]